MWTNKIASGPIPLSDLMRTPGSWCIYIRTENNSALQRMAQAYATRIGSTITCHNMTAIDSKGEPTYLTHVKVLS